MKARRDMTGATQEKTKGSLGEGKLKAVRESLVNSSTMISFFFCFPHSHRSRHENRGASSCGTDSANETAYHNSRPATHQEQLQDLQKWAYCNGTRKHTDISL